MAVLVLSLAPATPELPTTGWDKSNHFVGFAALAFLGCFAYPSWISGVLLGVFLYGGLIEIMQSFTTYRLAEWSDWIADGVGVGAGYALRVIAHWLGMSKVMR
jgi:VanZ family protein